MKTNKILTAMLIVVITIQLNVTAQNCNVTGTILDDSGLPMIGATINEKGTTNAVSTDINGYFSISTQVGSVLICSFVSCDSKEFIIKKKNLNNLSDSLSNSRYAVNLGEFALLTKTTDIPTVVVEGVYIRQKSGDSNGAISTINGAELMKVPSATLDKAMTGKLSGVIITPNSGRPGASSSIKIRGIGSINSGTEPLFVIDGMPISGDGIDGMSPLATINPADVEYVDVLKDAASCAIYGARGANGVIIIKTKRGNFTASQDIDPDEKNEYPLEIVCRLLYSGVKKIF